MRPWTQRFEYTALHGIAWSDVRDAPGFERVWPELRWLPGAQAARVLEAGHALGMGAGRVAAAEAVRLARDYGVGAVSVRTSNHFGPASC